MFRLTARVQTISGKRVRLRTAAGSLATWQRDIGQRSSVVVAIRPEELEVVTPADGELRALVQRVAPIGAQVVVELVSQVGSGVPSGGEVRLEAVVAAPGPTVGELVGLRPRAFHVFDLDGWAIGHVRRPG